jgi:hypothetical protein
MIKELFPKRISYKKLKKLMRKEVMGSKMKAFLPNGC